MREEDRLSFEVGDVLIARQKELSELETLLEQPTGEVFLSGGWTQVAFGAEGVFLVVEKHYEDDDGRQVMDLVSLTSTGYRFKFRGTAKSVASACDVVRREFPAA